MGSKADGRACLYACVLHAECGAGASKFNTRMDVRSSNLGSPLANDQKRRHTNFEEDCSLRDINGSAKLLKLNLSGDPRGEQGQEQLKVKSVSVFRGNKDVYCEVGSGGKLKELSIVSEEGKSTTVGLTGGGVNILGHGEGTCMTLAKEGILTVNLNIEDLKRQETLERVGRVSSNACVKNNKVTYLGNAMLGLKNIKTFRSSVKNGKINGKKIKASVKEGGGKKLSRLVRKGEGSSGQGVDSATVNSRKVVVVSSEMTFSEGKGGGSVRVNNSPIRVGDREGGSNFEELNNSRLWVDIEIPNQEGSVRDFEEERWDEDPMGWREGLMEGISKDSGVSYEGYEREACALFKEIESGRRVGETRLVEEVG